MRRWALPARPGLLCRFAARARPSPAHPAPAGAVTFPGVPERPGQANSAAGGMGGRLPLERERVRLRSSVTVWCALSPRHRGSCAEQTRLLVFGGCGVVVFVCLGFVCYFSFCVCCVSFF